ncbi:MAG TPA: hypothetical protein PK045_03390 [Candidatus Woesebacteria bacterium]|nr:hypothetical protein [Candidatus Woesebacteria bacterium]HPJ16915.1 hypothetical protein [Candidatus Woesebacteria bacterium]
MSIQQSVRILNCGNKENHLCVGVEPGSPDLGKSTAFGIDPRCPCRGKALIVTTGEKLAPNIMEIILRCNNTECPDNQQG